MESDILLLDAIPEILLIILFLQSTGDLYGDHMVITAGWRLSPAAFAHLCRGISLEEAITDNANIRGPFSYT